MGGSTLELTDFFKLKDQNGSFTFTFKLKKDV